MWWNSSYKFRRKMILSAPYGSIGKGTILIFPFDTADILSKGKVRSDYQDVQVVRHMSNSETDCRVLPSITDTNNVNFMIDQDIKKGYLNISEYFVYYGNPSLNNFFAVPGANTSLIATQLLMTTMPSPTILTGSTTLTAPLKLTPIVMKTAIPYVTYETPIQVSEFNGSFWSTILSPSSNKIAYTRPGVDWVDGFGMTQGAKATVNFSSDRVRIKAKKGLNQGIMQVKLDDEAWADVDLYNHTTQEQVVVYNREDLEPGPHIIQLNVSGKKNPDATEYHVNFTQFETLDAAKLENTGEEVNPNLVWTSLFGGAV